jgi:hypothetical protein
MFNAIFHFTKEIFVTIHQKFTLITVWLEDYRFAISAIVSLWVCKHMDMHHD